MKRNQTLVAVREFIRAPYAFPGGYPKILVMSDGETVCADCARKEYRSISNATRHYRADGWSADGVDIHWEGPPMNCAHCNAETDSAYGDPEASDEPCADCARSYGPHSPCRC